MFQNLLRCAVLTVFAVAIQACGLDTEVDNASAGGVENPELSAQEESLINRGLYRIRVTGTTNNYVAPVYDSAHNSYSLAATYSSTQAYHFSFFTADDGRLNICELSAADLSTALCVVPNGLNAALAVRAISYKAKGNWVQNGNLIQAVNGGSWLASPDAGVVMLAPTPPSGTSVPSLQRFTTLR